MLSTRHRAVVGKLGRLQNAGLCMHCTLLAVVLWWGLVICYLQV